jgi:HEAT repeat protein
MEFSTLFARHFARLVWLLLHEPTNIVEQKSALRAMVALSKFGAIAVESRDWQVVTNGEALPDSMSGAMELVAQMAVHGIRTIRFAVAPAAAHVLGVARFLATRPPEGIDAGREALTHLATIGATSVTLTLDEAVTIGKSNGAAPRAAATATASEPLARGPSALAEPPSNGASPTQPNEPSLAAEAQAPDQSGYVRDEASMWMHFSATPSPAGSVEDLFAQLDRFNQAEAITRVLDDLVTTAENAAREGKSGVVGDVFYRIVRREGSATREEIKRAYSMAVRRMSRPALLRAVAHLLPRKRDRHDDYLAVLARTGEDGADALIDQLTQAQTSDDRRIFFDVLLHLQAGVPALIHMLGDARWFVARNAAELLGEMRASDAEEPLKQLLRHHDDRVRRAATNALIALESASARQAVYDAVRDESPAVRVQAAAAISSRKDEKSAGTLTRALDDEVDAEVQLAIIAALGKVATTEAVHRLIKAAEPDGRLFFKKKSTAIRVAAVQALGEAHTPQAMAALWQMLEDKDREVRDAVQRLVGTRT